MRHINRLVRAALAAALLLAAVPGPAAWARVPALPPGPAAPEGSPFVIPPGCNYVVSGAENADNQAFGDFQTITSTLTITSPGASLWRAVAVTDIMHTYLGALNITLTSPQGTQVSLSTGNGGNANAFAGTVWVDAAGQSNPPGPVTLTPLDGAPETPLAPEEPLGAFRGEDPNGVWTLNVEDTDAFTDTGTLESWSLSLVTLIDTPDGVLSTFEDHSSHPIPDDGTPLVFPFTIPAAYASMGEISFTTEISHAEPGDLVIELIPPTGYTITLASNRGGDTANIFNGTEWNDKAGATNPPGAVTDSAYTGNVTESPLAPQEPLSAAAGNSPGGQWALRIRDTDSNAITGTLEGLAFSATSLICRPNLDVDIDRPDPARMDEPMPMWVEVRNNGAPTTAPILMTATLPISASFLSAGGPSWTCGGVGVGVMGGTLLCNRASSLAAGTTTTVSVLLSPPPAPKQLGDIEVTVMTAGNYSPEAEAVTLRAAATSANQQPWDVVDNLLYPTGGDHGFDTGGVEDGGQDAFDEWGDLRLRVFNAGGGLVQATGVLEHFGLVYAPSHRWLTTTPVVTGTIQVARVLYAPVGSDWLRYIDTFTNTSGASRTVWVAWGGDLGSDEQTLTHATSSGDAILSAADTWATTIESEPPDPPEDAVLGYAWRSPADTTYQGPGIFAQSTFTTSWPSGGNESLGHIFKLVLAPGASASLAYFVYRGLGEENPGPEMCDLYGDCVLPAPGSQVALAQATVSALGLSPNFCDLSPAEFAKIVNWPGKGVCGLNYLFLPVLQR